MTEYEKQLELVREKETILDILDSIVTLYPKKKAFHFLSYLRNEQKEEVITYAELRLKAKRVAQYLSDHDMKGKTTVLLYPEGLDFIIAFLGCLYAGVISVPLYHFTSTRKAERLSSVIQDSEATLFMTNSHHFKRLQSFTKDIVKENQWVATDVLADEYGDGTYPEQKYDLNDRAYLQYTSGSTSTPKGVMITHKNIVHNMHLLCLHYETSNHSVGVSWIPHYHDMGLIYTIFQPIYMGYTQVFMSPTDFLGKPYRYYKAITDFKGTTFIMPNFAFDYSVKMISSEQKKELDLSSVQAAGNGSEPIYYNTMNGFYNYFKTCGFEKKALLPGYGLAEATLAVTSSDYNSDGNRLTVIDISSKELEKNLVKVMPPGKDTQNCCSSGKALPDVQVRIVNPDTMAECAEDEVGEIWTASDSNSPGYWKKPDVSRKTFQAYLEDKNEGPFLRTGDLGFLHDNNLYISGRLKDVLVIRGVNYYPNDIEFAVLNSNPIINDNGCVAFTILEEGEEKLYIVSELARGIHQDFEPDKTVLQIRQKVSQMFSLGVKGVLLVNYGGIPKTSSGKVQRSLCKEQYIKQKLKLITCDIK